MWRSDSPIFPCMVSSLLRPKNSKRFAQSSGFWRYFVSRRRRPWRNCSICRATWVITEYYTARGMKQGPKGTRVPCGMKGERLLIVQSAMNLAHQLLLATYHVRIDFMHNASHGKMPQQTVPFVVRMLYSDHANSVSSHFGQWISASSLVPIPSTQPAPPRLCPPQPTHAPSVTLSRQ